MLVLSRRTEERIMIGNDIVVTILEIHHDHVRIGIEAPRSVDVHREEVFRLVQAANAAAAEGGGEEDRLASLRGLGGRTLPGAAEEGREGTPVKPLARLRKPPPRPKEKPPSA